MKSFILTLCIAPFLMATNFSTQYDVTVGMFGKVGVANVSIDETRDAYRMKLVATMVGTAAALTGNRVETYISTGKIEEGRYVPLSFIKTKKTNRDERTQTYNFDHANKSVTLIEEEDRLVTRSRFDTVAFKLVNEEVNKHTTKKSVLENYNEQDVLSSYLNTAKSCNAYNKKHTLLAIGAHNDKKDITLSFLEGLEKENVSNYFSKDVGSIYNLNVQALKKDEQEVNVLVALDNDGHLKEALLGDVFWVGEIKATRVYHKVSSNSAL